MNQDDVQKKSLSDMYGTCGTCGAHFKKFRPNHKYCCYECLRVHYRHTRPYIPRETKLKKCKLCGKEFLSNDSKRLYCSEKCYDDNRGNFYTRVEPRKVACEHCGTEFETRHGTKKYCSTLCYRKANAERIEERLTHGQ